MSTKKTPTRKTTSKRAPARKTVRPAVKTPKARKVVAAVAAEPAAVWMTAVRAAEDKKAVNIKVLDLRHLTTFADYLIVCTGNNQRQIQTIADEIELQLKQRDERPKSVEGYSNAEWVLLDYGDYVVNVFSEKARTYYDLERLWRDAPPVTLDEEPATTPAISEDGH